MTRKTERNYALATNIALEAAALSGGRPNYNYQRAQILRKHARREALILKPANAPRQEQTEHKRVWFEFTLEAEKLLDRALRASWPIILRERDRERETQALWRDHFGQEIEDTDRGSAFDQAALQDSKRRRDAYLKRTRKQREAEERAFWKTDLAEWTERWAGCQCGGTGYVLATDAEIEAGEAPATRRVRCEVCQQREREIRLALEDKQRHSDLLAWLIEWFAGHAGMTEAELLKSRGSEREKLNIVFTALLAVTGLTQADVSRVTGWSPSTSSRAINDVVNTWPELGRQDSPTFLPPLAGNQGRAPLSAGSDSSSGPASLPEKSLKRALEKPESKEHVLDTP